MKHIAVLKGGWSVEREVSLVSGAACAKGLRESGYKVTEIDMQPDIAEVLQKLKPDVVFNALHGRFGEDGCIQGLLELLEIPYTHSGVLASAVAMDKPMAKKLFEQAGLRCPKGLIATRDELFKAEPMKRPYVAKPANEGSSVGVYIAMPEDNRSLAVMMDSRDHATRKGNGEDAREYTQDYWLVEEYIPGREITVAVLGDKALGITEIRPKSGFYDYENKYTDGKTEHLCPAPLTPAESKEVMELALKAHRTLGCRGLSRADFRYDGAHFYLLEVNTQPGMTPLSLSPEIAAHAGISFNNLVQRLVEEARLGV